VVVNGSKASLESPSPAPVDRTVDVTPDEDTRTVPPMRNKSDCGNRTSAQAPFLFRAVAGRARRGIPILRPWDGDEEHSRGLRGTLPTESVALGSPMGLE